ncbi:urease subunit gamma [Streptomyces yangpuensis]|uniref:urease subunit gamma n=1 Tax=Streptomyces yangpuensis TaxID=1648182 RepID=UPI0036541837
MRLTPTERDRLLVRSTAEPAGARRARGLKLDVPGATALIADTVREAARDGKRLAEVHVEAVFDDGSRLAVVSSSVRGAVPLGDDAPGAVGPGPGVSRPASRTARSTPPEPGRRSCAARTGRQRPASPSPSSWPPRAATPCRPADAGSPSAAPAASDPPTCSSDSRVGAVDVDARSGPVSVDGEPVSLDRLYFL